MPFRNLTLKTSTSKNEYTEKNKDIERINMIFEPYGLKVDEVKEGAQVVRYILHMPLDVKLQGKVRRATKDIEYTLSSALGTDEFSYHHSEDNLIIERKGKFNIVAFGDLYTTTFHNNTKGLAVMLGKDLDGKPVYTNLEKAPHVLIAGTTGSGKSETIHDIIASLLMTKYRDMPSVVIPIIDIKGTEFNKYKDAYPVTIYKTADEAYRVLEQLCKTMDWRYKLLAENGCDDIDEYTSKGNKMSRIVCIIDELADLILQNRKVEDFIVRIAQKARACGIHLVIGTQSPRADVVTGLIKANIPFKIALNTTTSLESRIVLDENGAEKLFGKGDMLIKKGGNKPIHAQGAYVDDEDKAALNALWNNGKHVDIFPSNNIPTTPTMPSKKKVGLIQGFKNIMRSPQATTPLQFITIINKHPNS